MMLAQKYTVRHARSAESLMCFLVSDIPVPGIHSELAIGDSTPDFRSMMVDH